MASGGYASAARMPYPARPRSCCWTKIVRRYGLDCILADPPELTTDLAVCRLCGTSYRRFHKLIWMQPGDGLTISINVCLLCSRDLGR